MLANAAGVVFEHIRLGGGLCIAGHEEGDLSVYDMHNSRGVIKVFVALTGREHLARDAIPQGKGHARLGLIGRDLAIGDALQQVLEGLARVARVGQVDAADLEILHDLLHAADVVGMRVRPDEDIDLLDAELF